VQTDTRSCLIESATTLVRQRGYSAFSYADLAAAVGIRKPSIHHHFPSKGDLAAAVVATHIETFSGRLDDIAARIADPLKRIEAYAGLYRESFDAGQGCLCGVLASELNVLPAAAQAEVRRFFALNLAWLERTLAAAHAAGRLRRDVQAGREARTVLSTLQGALCLALTLQDARGFDAAVAGLLAGLRRARRPGRRLAP
jgi:TetR/AcrR family transcriptional repressor of nem operon